MTDDGRLDEVGRQIYTRGHIHLSVGPTGPERPQRWLGTTNTITVPTRRRRRRRLYDNASKRHTTYIDEDVRAAPRRAWFSVGVVHTISWPSRRTGDAAWVASKLMSTQLYGTTEGRFVRVIGPVGWQTFCRLQSRIINQSRCTNSPITGGRWSGHGPGPDLEAHITVATARRIIDHAVDAARPLESASNNFTNAHDASSFRRLESQRSCSVVITAELCWPATHQFEICLLCFTYKFTA